LDPTKKPIGTPIASEIAVAIPSMLMRVMNRLHPLLAILQKRGRHHPLPDRLATAKRNALSGDPESWYRQPKSSIETMVQSH
jgi:hypothetical protein